jgi:hypothetical protein
MDLFNKVGTNENTGDDEIHKHASSIYDHDRGNWPSGMQV